MNILFISQNPNAVFPPAHQKSNFIISSLPLDSEANLNNYILNHKIEALFLEGVLAVDYVFCCPAIRVISQQHEALFQQLSHEQKNSIIKRCQSILTNSKEIKNFSESLKQCYTQIYYNQDYWPSISEAITHAKKEFFPEINPSIRLRIVTPSYNHAHYIEHTIKSILSQKYKNFTYHISDGGSKDHTLTILEKYKDQLTWTSERDKGYADAVNKGFHQRQEDYGIWIPSDDFFLDEYSLSRLVQHAQRTQADIIYGDALYTNNTVIANSYSTQEFSGENFKQNCFICQPATLFRISSYQAVQGLNIALKSIADYDLWLKFLEKNMSFARLCLPISCYRLHDSSITVSQRGLTYKEIFQNQFTRFGYVHTSWVHGAIYHLLYDLDRIYNSPSHPFVKKIKVFCLKVIRKCQRSAWVQNSMINPLVNKIYFQKFLLKFLGKKDKAR